MATNAPDPKTFKTWEEAFKYPVPVVRRMEQQLRSDVASNKEKLRRLVGASYRDLLRTAERIIEMDEDIQSVETNLSEISRKCNSKVIDGIAKNCGDFERERKAAARLLRGGSTLLAAKLLVICRLFHKALSQQSEVVPLVDDVRNRLASLRGKLLRRVDAQFGSLKSIISTTLQDMCAYLLATSSTPMDVLRHFLHIRLEAIRRLLRSAREKRSSESGALKLYLGTIQAVRALFPTRLADMLAKLRIRPLVDDPDILSLVELDLDIKKRWLPQDVRNFIPWLHHEALQKTEVEKVLETWSNTAFNVFVQGLRQSVKGFEKLSMVVQLRKEIMRTWLDQDSASSVNSDQLDVLRTVFIDRSKQLIGVTAGELSRVGKRISTVIEQGDVGASEGLWAVSTALMDGRDNVMKLKTAVMDNLYGRNAMHRQVLEEYQSWLRVIEEVKKIINQLKEDEWDDDIDAAEDDDASDFDTTVGQMLSGDDPKLLEDWLGEAVTSAFEEMQERIQDDTKELKPDSQRRQAAWLLRVLRDIRGHLPQQGETSSFGLSVVTRLHQLLAEAALESSIKTLQQHFKSPTPDKPITLFELWDGSPALPVQPSPAIYRFVYSLMSSMAQDGSDIWTRSAVRQLKLHVSEAVSNMLNILVTKAKDDDVSEDGPEAPSNTDHNLSSADKMEEENDKYHTQLLFDVSFLRAVFRTTSTEDPLGNMEKVLTRNLKESDSSTRLQKNTQDFWKRTMSLFSLLA
ncbi:MAG: hypothetical protein M1816_001194 [Peltula sp. TS41687]|nr:MAG: hypothetical protein M1816_001194 [Peltula sp. TS41687]